MAREVAVSTTNVLLTATAWFAAPSPFVVDMVPFRSGAHAHHRRVAAPHSLLGSAPPRITRSALGRSTATVPSVILAAGLRG